jgi:hypothetical protein
LLYFDFLLSQGMCQPVTEAIAGSNALRG